MSLCHRHRGSAGHKHIKIRSWIASKVSLHSSSFRVNKNRFVFEALVRKVGRIHGTGTPGSLDNVPELEQWNGIQVRRTTYIVTWQYWSSGRSPSVDLNFSTTKTQFGFFLDYFPSFRGFLTKWRFMNCKSLNTAKLIRRRSHNPQLSLTPRRIVKGFKTTWRPRQREMPGTNIEIPHLFLISLVRFCHISESVRFPFE